MSKRYVATLTIETIVFNGYADNESEVFSLVENDAEFIDNTAELDKSGVDWCLSVTPAEF